MTSISVIPAYNRDYKSKAAVLKDWEDGKDFRSPMYGYINIDGAKLHKLDVQFHYDKQMKTFIWYLPKTPTKTVK